MKENTEILHKTLDSLKGLYAQEGLVPGVFLKAGIKPGWNVVIGSKGQCGMAMNFTDPGGVFGKEHIDFEKLKQYIGKDLFTVAEDYIKSGSKQERSVGVAALSGLSQPLLSPDMLERRSCIIRGEEVDLTFFLNPDDIVTVIGYGGAIQRLLGKCRELHVTDIRPRIQFQTVMIADAIEYMPREPIVHSEKENRTVIEKSTVIWMTGSTLVNGSFKELLGYASNARLIGIYGPSVSVIPDVLFSEGVDFVHTYRVTDPAAFEKGAFSEMNMEPVIRRTQMQYAIEKKPQA